MTDLILHITPEQRQHIESAARQRGYELLDDYLMSLVERDIQGKWDDEDDLTQAELEANFVQGLHEVMTGKTCPADKCRNWPHHHLPQNRTRRFEPDAPEAID